MLLQNLMIVRNEVSVRIKQTFLKVLPDCLPSIEDPNLVLKIKTDINRVLSYEKTGSVLQEVSIEFTFMKPHSWLSKPFSLFLISNQCLQKDQSKSLPKINCCLKQNKQCLKRKNKNTKQRKRRMWISFQS